MKLLEYPPAASLAIHESGHFVLCALLGFPTSEATIIRNPSDGTLGGVSHGFPHGADRPTDRASRVNCRRLLLVTTAGMAAERVAGLRLDPLLSGQDIVTGMRLAMALGSPEPLATLIEYVRRASRLIGRYRNAADEFAEALAAAGTIDGDELATWSVRIEFEKRLRRMPRGLR